MANGRSVGRAGPRAGGCVPSVGRAVPLVVGWWFVVGAGWGEVPAVAVVEVPVAVGADDGDLVGVDPVVVVPAQQDAGVDVGGAAAAGPRQGGGDLPEAGG